MAKKSRKTYTSDYLSQAFWGIYAKKPISQITVKELTEKAGVHRSSFYGHFEDIYDFFDKEKEQLFLGIENYMNIVGTGDISPLEKIMEYYQYNLFKISILCGENGDPSFLVKLRERIIPEIMGYLQIANDDKEAYYILDFIVTGVLSFLTTWYRKEGDMPSAEILKTIREVIMPGSKSILREHSAAPQVMDNFLNFNGLND